MEDEKKGMIFGIINLLLNIIVFILLINPNFYYRQQHYSQLSGSYYNSTSGDKIGSSLFNEMTFLGVLALIIVLTGAVISIITIVKGAKEEGMAKPYKGFVAGVTVVSFVINLFIFLLIFINSKTSTSGVSGNWTSHNYRLGLDVAGIFYLILSVLANLSSSFSCSFFDEYGGYKVTKTNSFNKKPSTVIDNSPSAKFKDGEEVIAAVDIPNSTIKSGDHLFITKVISYSGFVYCRPKNGGGEIRVNPSYLAKVRKEEINSTTKQQKTENIKESVKSTEKEEKIKQLDFLLESKLISEEEYNIEKEKIINS